MNQSENTATKSDSQDALISYLRDETAVKKVPPRTVVSNDAGHQCPFAHYAIPLAGDGTLRSLKSYNATRRRRRSSAGAAARAEQRPSVTGIPDVLDIRLTDKPIDMASPDSAAAPRGTVSMAGKDGKAMPQSPSLGTTPTNNTNSNKNNADRPKPGSVPKEQQQREVVEPSQAESGGSAPKHNVAQFLQQIPDLSFMLSSKLSLPSSNNDNDNSNSN